MEATITMATATTTTTTAAVEDLKSAMQGKENLGGQAAAAHAPVAGYSLVLLHFSHRRKHWAGRTRH